MFLRHASLLVLSLSLAVSAFGQQPKPDNPPPKQPAPTPPPSREQQPQQRERQTDFQRPIYVTGKVVLEDGTPLPNGVRVEMLFSGQVRRQDYTRVDGSFSFELGAGISSGAMADASMSSGDDPFSDRSQQRMGAGGGGMLGRVDLSGWEVRAVLPGYQSDVIVLQNRSALDNPDIGLVVLRPIGHVKATTISLTSMKAPKKAKEAYEKAFKAFAKEKPDVDKASKELLKATELYPEYAAAWDMLGQIKMRNKDLVGARDAFQKALAADANFASPYIALADIELQEKKYAQAADLTGKLLELNPHVPRGQFLNAVANFQLGKLDVAEDSIRKLQSSNEAGSYTISHYVLGAILATKGNLPAAAGEFQLFLQKSPQHQYAVQVREKLAEWQKQGVVAQNPTPTATPAATPAGAPAATAPTAKP